MRRIILAILFFLAVAVDASAQSTTVSGQVTDGGGQSWNNGTFTATFVPNPQYPTGPYTWAGGTLNTTITGTLSGTGSYSVSIPSNSAISPQGSQWQFQFNPNATSTPFLSAKTSIAGATQTLNATPPAISINLQNPPGPFTTAYADAEIASPIPLGAQYFNVTSLATRVWNGSAWNNQGGGSGGATSIQTAATDAACIALVPLLGEVCQSAATNTVFTGPTGFGALAFFPDTYGTTLGDCIKSGGQANLNDAGGNCVTGTGSVGAILKFINTSGGTSNSALSDNGTTVSSTESISLTGSTSGSATIGVAAVAGTPNQINLPTATGSAGQFLQTNGANPQQTSWQTPSFTPAYPVTVSGTVNSGGIPYFSSTTQESSSALLTANALIKGGGAGGAPSSSSVTDNGTTISTAESFISSAGTSGVSGLVAGLNQVSVAGSAASNATNVSALATGGTVVVNADQNINLSSVNSQIRVGNPGGSNPTVLRFMGNTSGNCDETANATGTTITDSCVRSSTKFSGGDGTVAAPGFCFTSSTACGTGLFRDSAGFIEFPILGSSSFTAGSSGAIAGFGKNYNFFSNVGVQDTGLSRDSAGVVDFGNGTNGDKTGTIIVGKYKTGTDCASSASPAVCGSAADGSVVIAAAATTVTVNTTAVTANGEILLTPDDTLGTKLGVTCNSTLATLIGGLAITARSAGTSFQVTSGATPAVNPLCFSYKIDSN